MRWGWFADPLTLMRGHGRIGPPEGDDGPDGRECAMAASSFEEPAARLAAASRANTGLSCPSCGSSHVAQMLGDNGGVSYVCTSCGHSWS